MPSPLAESAPGVIRYGREAESVFDLLGRSEVDLTAAVGWTLAHAPVFLNAFLDAIGVVGPRQDLTMSLEEADAEGRTDVELTGAGLAWKVVIEAKQGWLLPGADQLARYASRFDGFDQRFLVTMSDSSARWAMDQLVAPTGIEVRHEPWDTVRKLLRDSQRVSRGRERFWIEQLRSYMGRATSVRPFDEQWVYCVVLNDVRFGQHSFKDYVRTERVYFHPYGGRNRWPKRPVTLLAFRWQGRVRQVNRVESSEVIPDLRDIWPDLTENDADRPHMVYHLGPDIPLPEISTTGTYANARVWALLDQMLTQPTLADAVRASNKLKTQFG